MDFDITQTQIKFWIDGEVISKCSLQRILNLSDSYVLKPMTDEEEELFLKICVYYGRAISLNPELLQNMALKLRNAVNEDEDIMDGLYKLMRHGERSKKCHPLNGMVRLLLTRKKNYAALIWVLMNTVPNFLKWVTGKVMGKSYLKWFIQRFFICYEGIRRH